MTHLDRTSTRTNPHWALTRSQGSDAAKLFELRSAGSGRRRFLTMAGVGSAATAVCVAIATLDPAVFLSSPW